MDYLKHLPTEITLDIFSRLPTESVLDCKLVCSNWRRLVSHNPSFGKMHLHRLNHPNVDSDKLSFIIATENSSHDHENYFYFEYNENHESTSPIHIIRKINLTSPIRFSRLVGSCNGLICFAGGPYAWICNPITRECVMLPEIKRDNDILDWTFGFGYVSSTDEYKVVGIYTYDANFAELYIYTLGSGKGWRNLEKFNFESDGYIWVDEPGVFAGGALFWLKVKKIIAFDLAQENFVQNLSPPPLPPNKNWCRSKIGVLDGILYIAAFQGGNFYDIWLLKKKSVNHDMKEQEEHQSSVWSKEYFRIGESRLFAITKSDCILTKGPMDLNIYDTRTSTTIRLVKFKSWIRQVSPHMSTFISLKELGEKDTKTMESVEIDETRSCDYSFEQLQDDMNPE